MVSNVVLPCKSGAPVRKRAEYQDVLVFHPITGHCPPQGIHVTGTQAGQIVPGVQLVVLSVVLVVTLVLTLNWDQDVGMQVMLDTVTQYLVTVYTLLTVTVKLSASSVSSLDQTENTTLVSARLAGLEMEYNAMMLRVTPVKCPCPVEMLELAWL